MHLIYTSCMYFNVKRGKNHDLLKIIIPPILDPEVLFQKGESLRSLLFCTPHGPLEVCQSMLSDELEVATMANLKKD